MITAIYFEHIVSESFKYLINEFDFEHFGVFDSHRSIRVNFKKNNFIVSIEYSRSNNYIGVNFYRNIDEYPPWVSSLGNRALLMGILHDKNANIDYDAIMPNKIPIEVSVVKVSELLREYCTAILNQTEWI